MIIMNKLSLIKSNETLIWRIESYIFKKIKETIEPVIVTKDIGKIRKRNCKLGFIFLHVKVMSLDDEQYLTIFLE